MLVVDPWQWLNDDGLLPSEPPRLRSRILRVVQLIETGGPVPRLHARETTLPCLKRPKRKACPGLVWVIKTDDDCIHAYCPVCRNDEAMIHNWQDTEWAEGPMEPVSVELFRPTMLN